MQLITQGGQAANKPNTALALGYFDGIHKGHRSVIETAVTYANKNDLCPAVFTFVRNTQQGQAKKRIMSEEQKLAVLSDLGVDVCFEPDFNSFCNLTPRQFFESYIIQKYRAKALFCGENYGFGSNRSGDTALLAKLCHEFGLHLQVLPLTYQDGRSVSSSRIRETLEAGLIEDVTVLLQRPYELCLPVQHGQGLGRSFGFPTINQLIPKERQAPAFGVYITSTFLDDRWYPSATGYGTRPTVLGQNITCETFIPGFNGNVYGKNVCVRFYKRLADTQKFQSVTALSEAVHSWAKQAQAFFANP